MSLILCDSLVVPSDTKVLYNLSLGHYRRSSVVCLSGGRSVAIVRTAKTVEPIEMPFGMWTWVDARNHVLDGGPDPPIVRGNFEGGGAPHCKV